MSKPQPERDSNESTWSAPIVLVLDGKRYVVCTCGHPDCKRVPVSQ